MRYNEAEIKDMIKQEEKYLKGLKRDVRFSEMEIAHLKECLRVIKGKEK